jgi:hypothetical protein
VNVNKEENHHHHHQHSLIHCSQLGWSETKLPPTPPNTNKQIIPLPRRGQPRYPNRTLKSLLIVLYISPYINFFHFISVPAFPQRSRHTFFTPLANRQRPNRRRAIEHRRASGPHAALSARLAIDFRPRRRGPGLGRVAAHVCACSGWRRCKRVF